MSWLQNRKSAAMIGGEPEVAFEQSFAQIATQYIADKAPGLMNYIVGFQLVDKTEDNYKASGIFGFKAGDEWYYAPVFFINGKLKGHELLYVKSSDTFVPLAENWINYLLSRKPSILGESTPYSRTELGIREPNFDELRRPPGTHKYGSDQQRPNIPKWLEDFMPVWAACGFDGFCTDKFAGLDERVHIPDLLKADKQLWGATDKLCREFPQWEHVLKQAYGAGVLKAASDHWRNKTAAIRRAPITAKPVQKSAASRDPVEIVVYDDVIKTVNKDQPPADLNEDERAELLRKEYLIKDHRNAEEVSVVFDTNAAQTLQNPTETGIYDVLVRPGTFRRLAVIMDPHSVDGRERFAVVLDPSSAGGRREYINATPQSIFVRPSSDKEDPRQEFEAWADTGSSTSDMEEGGTYVVVNGTSGSVPFIVIGKHQDGVLHVQPHLDHITHPPGHRSTGYGEGPAHAPYFGQGDPIVRLRNPGSSFKSNNGELFVPEDSKVVRLDKRKIDKWGYPEPETPAEKADRNPIQPGSIVDLQMFITEKTSALKVLGRNGEVYINSSEPMTYKSALFSLVKDWGLREKAATEVLKRAERRDGAIKLRVKKALGPGPSAPAIPPAFMTDTAVGPHQSLPTVVSDEYRQSVPELQAGLTDPEEYNYWKTKDDNAVQGAMAMGRAGKKEVFDTSMFSSLLKATRQDLLVDRYLPDVVKALDRIGRLLFKFYWHNEEFMDRYGKADLPELEDVLRNTFESLGDLVLYMRQKTVEPSTIEDLGDPGLDSADAT